MGSGSYSYSYDGRGETTGETVTLDSSSYSFSFGYNDAGQPTSLTYSDGEVLSLSYGGTSGWLSSAATTPSGSSTAINLATNITYSGVGGALGQPSGASVAGGTYSFSASADADLRPSAMSLTTNSTGTTVFASNRTYDGVGNVQTVATTLAAGSGGTDNQAFCYDEQNRLTWAGAYSTAELACGGQYTPGSLTGGYYSTGHTYDTLDRLTSATGTGGAGTYTYGDAAHLHAVTSTSSGYSAAYDAAGDMTCRSLSSATTCSGSSPTGQKLSYDNEGRLVGWQNAWTTPTSTASDAYDGEGNRVAQQSTPPNQPTSTTYYVAGGLEEVNNNTLTKYERVPGVISVVIQGSGSGESVSYLATDGLGSVSEALDGSGHVIAQQLYGPFGGIRYSTGTMPTARGYTGQYADAASSGLDYYGARYYDPVVGQFTAADTVLDGLNRYAYVGNNPETATDPSGHFEGQPDKYGPPIVQDPDAGVQFGQWISGVAKAMFGISLGITMFFGTHFGIISSPPAPIPVAGDQPFVNQGTFYQPGTPLSDMGPETINQGTFFHPGAGPGPGSTPTTTTPPTTTPTTTPTAPTTLPVTQSWAPPTSYPSVSSDDPCIDSGMGFVRNACVQFFTTTPPFNRTQQYGRMTKSDRERALKKAPICPYCGQRLSSAVDHIRSVKQDFVEGGYNDDYDTRTARVNDPSNLIGACRSCNSSKGALVLGPGSGEWWPSAWPPGVWWPFGGP